MAKNSSLSLLKELLQNLTPLEIKAIGKYLNSFDSNNTVSQNKSLKLFRLIVRNSNLSKEEAQDRMGYKNNQYGFSKLTNRLRNRILEALLLEVNVERKNAFSDWYKAKIDLRKKIMQTETLIGRGSDNNVNDILNYVRKKATKYELYEELYDCLIFMRSRHGLKYGLDSFDSFNSEIEECRFNMNSVKVSKENYYRHVIRQIFSSEKKKDIYYLSEYIEEIEDLYMKSSSKNVQYYLLTLRMEFCELSENFDEARKVGSMLVDIVKNEPPIFMRSRLAATNARMANIEIHLMNFSSAIEHAKVAQKNFSEESRNRNISLTLEFNALFFTNSYTKCMHLIEKISKTYEALKINFEFHKSLYYKSCSLFCLNDFMSAYNNLAETRSLERDKEGWNIGIRILTIMCFVEMAFLDIADAKIEATRKHVERIKELTPLRKRDELIFKILRSLEKESFDFQVVFDKHRKDFELLKSDHEDYAWKIMSHEMIVFHQWFEAKLNNKPYQFVAPKA